MIVAIERCSRCCSTRADAQRRQGALTAALAEAARKVATPAATGLERYAPFHAFTYELDGLKPVLILDMDAVRSMLVAGYVKTSDPVSISVGYPAPPGDDAKAELLQPRRGLKVDQKAVLKAREVAPFTPPDPEIDDLPF